MQVSFNTYKPYLQGYKSNNIQPRQNQNVNFTSGYGADEFDIIDESNMTPESNGRRWRNIGKAVKMMTVDAYREANCIDPKKADILYSKEECQKFQDQYYKGTDLEGVDPNELIPPEEPVNYLPDPFDDDY